MEISVNDFKNRLVFTQVSSQNFKVLAAAAGDFKIQARINSVLSNVLDVHIYQPISTNFNEVNLAPGCVSYV